MPVLQRPFRSPHHTISDVALVGGVRSPSRRNQPRPRRGPVLDELPEMPRHVLEVLRQPLESREMTVISRAWATVVFPADFQLVAAMNPCPCGALSAGPRHRRLQLQPPRPAALHGAHQRSPARPHRHSPVIEPVDPANSCLLESGPGAARSRQRRLERSSNANGMPTPGTDNASATLPGPTSNHTPRR